LHATSLQGFDEMDKRGFVSGLSITTTKSSLNKERAFCINYSIVIKGID
jgi:hypothetical protein